MFKMGCKLLRGHGVNNIWKGNIWKSTRSARKDNNKRRKIGAWRKSPAINGNGTYLIGGGNVNDLGDDDLNDKHIYSDNGKATDILRNQNEDD